MWYVFLAIALAIFAPAAGDIYLLESRDTIDETAYGLGLDEIVLYPETSNGPAYLPRP